MLKCDFSIAGFFLYCIFFVLVLRSCHKLGVESFERMLGEVDEDVWSVAVGNDNLDAGIGNLVGCLHLRLHATSAHPLR